jgi:cobalt-zinc-cadmium efflux system membrane fusion protein
LVSGLVQKIVCTEGDQVVKDQVLFELSGNEFFELQKDFAGASSQFRKMKSEYERIQSLFKDKVGTEKELISAESEYKNILATYHALKMKIQWMGLDASRIEDADFYHAFSIKSPINGCLSRVNVALGQHADQQTTMAEIIDNKQLQLKLAVFEKDINKLIPGQKIKFKLSDNSNTAYDASLISIGRTVDPDSKTIQCYAGIDDLNSANFVNNAYAEVEIITKTEMGNAVSEESVLKSEGAHYVLAYVKEENDSYYLKNVKIEIGRSGNGYVEILNEIDFSKILTKGVFNIKVE